MFTLQILSGTSQDDQLFTDARVFDSKTEEALQKLADLNESLDASQSDSSSVINILRIKYQAVLRLLEEADDAYEKLNNEAQHTQQPNHLDLLGKSIDSTRHSRRRSTVSATSPHAPAAGIHQHNVSAFCIATLYSADLDQKLLQHSQPHAIYALFPTITDASQNPNRITSEEASRMYQDMKTKMYRKTVANANALERGKPRDTALEERDASVMQKFCIAQESGTPEYASLVSHTLICLSTYLNQRSDDETSLHPHYDGVPHRHCQLFNRTWCRLAELRFEAPVLRFALLQVRDQTLYCN